MIDYLARRLHAWLCRVSPTFQSNLQRLPVHWLLLRKSQSMRPQGSPEFSHERIVKRNFKNVLKTTERTNAN